MIITMASDCTDDQVERLAAHLRDFGFQTHTLVGAGPTVIGATGRVVSDELIEQVQGLAGVSLVNRSVQPYMLAQRAARPAGSQVAVGEGSPVIIGAGELTIMAGTCSVENREITLEVARAVKANGGHMLRGGAFKPRTSPYSFQGLGEDGLQLLAEAREETGLPIVTEVMEPDQVDLVASYADMLQIGSRNMANFPLLRRVATTGKPILLKRGFSATVNEWLMSAEYILAGGNDNIVLCERGIRAFDTSTRFTLDLNAVPLVKRLTHLPVIVDPSHGVGIRDLVPQMALAGVASGADGLMVEIHPDPDSAMSDADQTISLESFGRMMVSVRAVREALQGSTGLAVVA
ncbi:MAG: 3-deoxy-7-phosphoheptulonate synthase [Thermomicrobiales bacterium]